MNKGCGKWVVAFIDEAKKHAGMGAACGDGPTRCRDCQEVKRSPWNREYKDPNAKWKGYTYP